MALTPITFCLPDEVILAVNRSVSPSRQSAFVAQLLMRELVERDRQLSEASELANADPDLNALIEEWQAMHEPSLEY